MRTSGRRLKSGERSRALCSYCGTRWDRRDLTRDAAGLLACPQEGRGRDAVTLTRENVMAARAHAQGRRPEPYDAGPLDNEVAVDQGERTGNLLAEDTSPLLTEGGIYILQG